jgi:predicted short-subunit dehydrogenase-like oxidoreductase (DUF2520 family)
MESSKSIIIFGSGRLAYSLAQVLIKQQEFSVKAIISTNENSGRTLAQNLNASFFKSWDIALNADYILLCVPDNSLQKIAKQIENYKGLALHLSGGLALSELNNLTNFGVLYPLQTFNGKTEVNWKDIPLLLEANTKENLRKLEELATVFGSNILHKDSKQRAIIHLGAVFANNFTNFVLHHAFEVLTLNELNPAILRPLIYKTIDNCFEIGPKQSQTGPAIRNDTKTIAKHLQILEKLPEQKNLYTLLSEGIGKLK